MSDPPSPERAPTEPSQEALEASRKLIQNWVDMDIPIYAGSSLVIHQDIALALDRFRAAGVREERLRCAAIVASESFNDEDAFDRMERNILSGASP